MAGGGGEGEEGGAWSPGRAARGPGWRGAAAEEAGGPELGEGDGGADIAGGGAGGEEGKDGARSLGGAPRGPGWWGAAREEAEELGLGKGGQGASKHGEEMCDRMPAARGASGVLPTETAARLG